MTGRSSTSQAAVVTGWGKLELRELPLPPLGAEDGLLEVEAVGVCGTDWEYFAGHRAGVFPDPPHILGHEIVGRISAIGPRAAERWGVGEGDRVILESTIPCWGCDFCRRGHYNLCLARQSYGVWTPMATPPHLWGGFAEYVYLHPNAVLHQVPATVHSNHAALFVPLANGFRWTTRLGGLRVGDVAVILGPGQQGLGCLVAARQAGAGCIVVSGLERDEARLAIARALGADYTIQSDREDLLERVAAITGGRLADLVVECSGAPSAQREAPKLCGRLGTIVLAGLAGQQPAALLLDEVSRKEITIRGAYTYMYDDVEDAIRLLASGTYPLERLATHEVPLAEADYALRLVGRAIPDEDPIHVTVSPRAGAAGPR